MVEIQVPVRHNAARISLVGYVTDPCPGIRGVPPGDPATRRLSVMRRCGDALFDDDAFLGYLSVDDPERSQRRQVVPKGHDDVVPFGVRRLGHVRR